MVIIFSNRKIFNSQQLTIVIDGLYAESEATMITLRYVVYVTCYAALLTTGILSIAVAAFQKREVG